MSQSISPYPVSIVAAGFAITDFTGHWVAIVIMDRPLHGLGAVCLGRAVWLEWFDPELFADIIASDQRVVAGKTVNDKTVRRVIFEPDR